MIQFIKNNYKYLFLFLFIFLIYYVIVFPSSYGDPLIHYAYSHAIVMGELPYVDFNMIAPPLYAYIMSIGLFICDHYIVFLIEQALLMTIMFYFLKQLLDEKIYVLIFAIVVLFAVPVIATFNSLTLLFLVLIVFLEKKYSDKDFLIGIMIGLAILCKHTIGIFFVIPSLFFFYKDFKRLIKRFGGILLVIGLFTIYLIITGSLYSFFDLCILGLFDFADKNGKVFNIWHIVSAVLIIISLIITIKNKKKIENYYLLMGIFFAVPLFDFGHFAIYLFCFLIQVLFIVPISFEKYKRVLLIITIIYSCLLSLGFYKITNFLLIKDWKHLNNYTIVKSDYDGAIVAFKYFDQYEDAILLSYYSPIYSISKDKKIDYFTVLNYGNHGFDGTNKMIKRINNTHNTYYIIDLESYGADYNRSQFNREIADYIMDNFKLIDKKYEFEVYYKE